MKFWLGAPKAWRAIQSARFELRAASVGQRTATRGMRLGEFRPAQGALNRLGEASR